VALSAAMYVDDTFTDMLRRRQIPDRRYTRYSSVVASTNTADVRCDNWAYSEYRALASISRSHYIVISRSGRKLALTIRVMLP